MPNFKVVFQFQQGIKGFSEVYYRYSTDLPSAAVFNQPFLDALCNVHFSNVVCIKARVSDVLNNRNAVLVPINQAGSSMLGTPDITGTAGVCLLNAPTIGTSRKVWLRGLNDAVTAMTFTGGSRPAPEWLQQVRTYIRALTTNGFLVRGLVKAGPPPNNFVPIKSLTATASAGRTTLNYDAGPVIPPGGSVNIGQVPQKAYPGLKGIFVTLASTPTSCDIPYNSLETLLNFPLTKGRFRQAIYQYGAIDSNTSDFQQFATRITGRGPLGGRGSRRGARGLRSA